jgi:hypothetical protein
LIVEDLDNCNPTLYLALVSATTGTVTPWVAAAKDKNGWRHSDNLDGKSATAGGSLIFKPCQLAGSLQIPEDFGTIGALLVRLVWPNTRRGTATSDNSVYLESLLLDENTVIPIHSYIFDTQGTRVFFSSQGYISQNTPRALAEYRAADLEVTQGLRTSISEDGAAPPVPPYTSKDRVYDYDVYNDLGGDPKVADFQRPTLGGAQLPYPRRIKTGRPLNPGANTESKPTTSQPYLPKNELFTSIREQGFSGNIFKNVALSAISVIGTLGRGGADFDEYQDVYSWFKANKTASMEATPGAAAITASRHGASLKWPSPAVVDGRPDMWRSDEEFGRQVLAGQNPVTVSALRSLDGTAFSSKTVPRELTCGIPLEELVAAAAKDADSCRVFQLDYTTIFEDFIEKVATTHENRVLYGARCLLFSTSQGKLLPIAVELTRKKGSTPEVFTPFDGPGVWTLAKLFVAANDSSVHQVVSHFLRTHAAVEAIIIATRRQLSLAHPINRLLQKHTTYTLQINSLARGALINAGGIIERAFSPGNFAMELGARVYEAAWTFENQALPNDLVARGMAVEDTSAPVGVRLLKSLADYPFATDGLQLWAILEDFVRDYVDLYYKNDEQVLQDAEIVAWWEDIQKKAHPDIHRGWPVLNGRVSLTRILTTIIYIASAHHAAVNFGQYDFSGLLLNRSSKIRKQFPERGSEEYKLLASGADYAKIEKTVLSYLAGPVDYATVLSVIEVLSGHDDKEAYLGAPDAWVLDAAAKERYSKFAENLAAFEKDISVRNANSELINRCGDYVVPYTLLIPSSGGGVTRRGVPNSISI